MSQKQHGGYSTKMQENKNLENSIENTYNAKVEKNFFNDDQLTSKIKEMGFEIKREIELIDTYCLKLYIPEYIEKKGDYITEKVQELANLEHILRVEKAVEIKALNKKQEQYKTNQNQQPY